MDTSVREKLESAGIDVAGALERFMGNDALLERFLKKFPDDPNYGKLTAAIANQDQEAALTAAHTLKGVCGNLAMNQLFELLSRQVAAFRAGDWQTAAGLMPPIREAYCRITGEIKNL